MAFRPVLTIRGWLSLLVLACLVPTELATLLLFAQLDLNEHRLADQTRVETSRALMQAIDRELSGAQAALRALATSSALDRNDLATFGGQLLAIQELYPQNNFVLSDASGQQLLNTLRAPGAPLPGHGNPAQLRRVFETGRPVVSDLYLGGVTRQPVISVDVPVLRGGRVRYDLSMGILPAQAGEVLRRQQLQRGWIAGLVDSQGKIVARTIDQERFVGRAIAPDVSARLQAANEDSLSTVTLEGIHARVSFSRSALSGWSVAIAVPEVAISRQRADALAWLGLATGMSLLLGLALAAVSARHIARQVLALVPAARALGRGEPVALAPAPLREADQVARAMIDAAALLRRRTVERDHAERAERDVRAVQQRLAESEAFQRRLFEEAPNALLLVAPDGGIRRANRAAEQLFGYPGTQLQALSVDTLVPPAQGQQHAALRAGYMAHPTRRSMGSGLSLFGRRADGSLFPADVLLAPLGGSSGGHVLATVLDMTGQRHHETQIQAALAEKETLLKEVYHRVKNNLQVIASMIRLQGRAMWVPEARLALEEAAGRVRAMALVHEKLYRSRNLALIPLDTYLSELCQALGDAGGAAQRGIALGVAAPPLPLGLDLAIPIGLVVNELVSNSLKHAFAPGRGGRIAVTVTQAAASLLLCVEDNGAGTAPQRADDTHPSIGLKLVAALTRQLDAEFSTHNAETGGTVACLRLPWRAAPPGETP